MGDVAWPIATQPAWQRKALQGWELHLHSYLYARPALPHSNSLRAKTGASQVAPGRCLSRRAVLGRLKVSTEGAAGLGVLVI